MPTSPKPFYVRLPVGLEISLFRPSRDLSATPPFQPDSRLCRLRRTQAIEAEAMTPVGEAVDTTEHGRYRPRPVPPAIRNMTRIWYLTASAGGTPPRICPVIMPGRETTPVADIELIVGISALRSA